MMKVEVKLNAGALQRYVEAAKKAAVDTMQVVYTDLVKLVMPCVINVTEWGAGDARNVAPLAFDAMSDGKPTFTPA